MLPRWITELIGLFASFCTTLSLVPQLHRMWKAKSAHDLSLAMFFVFGVGVALWLLYGIGIGSLAVIATNSVSLVLVAVIYSLAVHYEHGKSDSRRGGYRESRANAPSVPTLNREL
jgi:MtN3 and saliva related transmembrane protein